MCEPSAKPSLMAHSTAFLFITGRVPGRARSTAQAWVLGSAPKAVLARLKILRVGSPVGRGFQSR